MPELSFVLAGTDTSGAADALIAALGGGDGVKATTTPAPALPEVQRRIVDPIALASLIVSIPGATLAVADIVDRIRKRRKAQTVIDTAQRLRSEQQVETYLLAADQTPRAVADLDADKLLDLVVEIDRPAK
jgi:hypothetical protein